MVSDSYKPGEVPALVIFKTTKPGPGLLWLPSEAGEVNCSSGLQPFELGQWILFNQTNGKVVRPLDTGPYESRCYEAGNENGDKFAQVRIPLVYFSEKTLNEMVLYSRHFDKIGSLYTQERSSVFHDKFQWAEIAYMARYRDQSIRDVMQSLEVDWLVVKLDKALSRAELKAQDDLGHFKFVSGLVVGIEEQRELCEKEGGDAGDENGSSNDATTNSSGGNSGVKLWTAVNIWVAELPGQDGPGIAVHRFRSGQPDEEQRKLAVGQFCKLMPVRNWANGYTAVSAIVSSKQPKGFQVESVEPLKLRVMNDCYALDQNPDVPLVHVPNFLGPIQCKPAFVRELRRERQHHPLLIPRLHIEFKPSPDGGFWDACHFDGRGNSPPPPAERPAPPPAAAVPVPMPPAPVKTGGFGNSGGFGSSRGGARGQFNNFLPQSGYQSTSTGSSSFNTSTQSTSASSSANFPSKPAPAPARPAPAPTESTMTGGFGRSRRDVSSSRSITPVPIAHSPLPPESGLFRRQQQGDDNSRPPSVSSDFADSAGEEVEERAEQQQRQPSPGHPPPQQQFRAGGQARRGAPYNAGGGGGRPGTSTSSSFSGTARPQLATNLPGIVVSQTDSTFFVFTSHANFPNELRLPRNMANGIPGLEQGSWIRFDAMENDPGQRVARVLRVEQPTHPTRVVRNTVQIDCMGIVPRRWNPQVSTFVPEISTDVVGKVIDAKHLLDQDYANAQLTVTIERGKPKDWPGYSWFIAKVPL